MKALCLFLLDELKLLLEKGDQNLLLEKGDQNLLLEKGDQYYNYLLLTGYIALYGTFTGCWLDRLY